MSEQGSGGGGFTPLTPIGGPSLEQEERAMRSGRGRMLFAMVGAVLVAGAGLVWFVSREQPSEYGQLGRQINGMRGDHFDAFWGCALPRAELDEITGAERLIAEIAERAATPRAYAQHVRETCLVMLDEHLPPLATLIVPADMTADAAALRAAIEELRVAWPRLLEHLDRLEGPFVADDDATRALLTAVAQGWFNYKQAHRQLNTTIRTHLDE